MRITQGVLINNMLRNYNKNMAKMDKLNTQLATGTRINTPSDDPAGLVTSLRLRTKLHQNEQYKKNVSDALSWMEIADSALNNYNSVLQRVRELTVEAANGTNEPSSLKAIADELKQLKDEIGDIANTTLDDRYIFGGTRTMDKVYDKASGQWLGNANPINYEIGENITLQVNLTGEVFDVDFSTDSPELAGSIFATLDKLIADVENGLYEEIGGADLAKLDEHINNLLSYRSEVGAKMNRLEMVNSRLEDTEVNYTKLLSDNEDVNMAKVIIELTNQENIYRASLAAGARIIQPSLVDFLR
ncbi:MAG: flagellar hook-associated protein FlgL [Clostridia bacterium]|nr:flagellar hook-associated protein FlgL [Clostridia bacterium]